MKKKRFVFSNNFAGAGGPADIERAVQLGILQSMRRLGEHAQLGAPIDPGGHPPEKCGTCPHCDATFETAD